MHQKPFLNNWCVYIIELSDGSYYTGVTNNLDKRLQAHSNGQGSAYVRSRLPIVGVVYLENNLTKNAALKREIKIKKMKKQDKIKLIEDYRRKK